ncbi:inverse autotransporter beta domain-containing protein [Candidatus Thioglobus sp.]|uniref:inverse autotransporter beta domain-containing protein n=1 Tax=Candidatus Thioglobus sp. TaxID=2026721 RepID=UPI003D1471F7
MAKSFAFKALTKLKHFLVFGALTLSLNVTSAGDIQDFDKAAYLNLNQNYTNDYQAINAKEENEKISFFKEIFSSVRNSLGGTNSDNTNQLGDKITSDLKSKLENKAINETESFINTQANEFANSFGNGRTEISIHKIESNQPDYSINTIQPLTELNEDSTTLTFIQAQLNSGENHGERRATINLGIGYRALLEGGQSIAGINLFTDYETKSKHKRASLGLEYQRANFTANVNKYYPLSDKVVIGDYTKEPLSGYDVRLTGQVPYLP